MKAFVAGRFDGMQRSLSHFLFLSLSLSWNMPHDETQMVWDSTWILLRMSYRRSIKNTHMHCIDKQTHPEAAERPLCS